MRAAVLEGFAARYLVTPGGRRFSRPVLRIGAHVITRAHSLNPPAGSPPARYQNLRVFWTEAERQANYAYAIAYTNENFT